MANKTVTVFGATGVAGIACVNEFMRQGTFDVCVLARKPGQSERSSSGMTKSEAQKQAQYDEWTGKGVTVRTSTSPSPRSWFRRCRERITWSCVPLYATESQYP